MSPAGNGGRGGLAPEETVRLIETSLRDFSMSFGTIAGARCYLGPDVNWCYSGAARLNRVVNARFTEAEADRRIEGILRVFADLGIGAAWFVGPGSEPADLGQRLLRHGLTHRGDWAGMARGVDDVDAGQPASSGLEVVEVTDADGCRVWAETAAAGFGMAPAGRAAFIDVVTRTLVGAHLRWRRYLGYAGDAPVATSSLFVEGGIAGMYYVSTVPPARGKGYGTALTVHSMLRARHLGHELVVLQASPAGATMYRRLGFGDHCRIGVYDYSA